MRTTKILSLLTILVIVVSALAYHSCKKDKEEEPPPLPQNDTLISASANIGPGGGQIELPDGSKLIIPANALSSNTIITLSKFKDAPTIGNSDYEFIKLEPDGLIYNSPTILELPYTNPTRIDSSLLSAFTARDGIFENLESTIDQQRNVVIVTIPHHSFVSLFLTQNLYCVIDIPGKYLLKGDLIYAMTKAGIKKSWFPGHTGLYLGTKDPLSNSNDGQVVIQSEPNTVHMNKTFTSFKSGDDNDHIYMGARRFNGTTTNQNPTTSDAKTTDGSGTGSFTSNITGLTANTPYYVRAYATNSAGTAYGNQVNFTTTGSGTVPTVTTASITNITQTTATGGGNVTAQGSSSVTARGVCWSTTSNPTTSDAHTTNGSGTGSFTSNITGLTANTPYYVRAYATNSAGTAYGNQVNFTTTGSSAGEPCPGIPTITDPRDGQVYPTVQIGSQCWLQKNMNYSTGNSWCYDDNTSNCTTYGRLYDWQTALGACPSGWHLPSDDEWTDLTTFLGGGSIAGGKMKEAGTTHWASPNTGATNSSGFTALPGGYRGITGSFVYLAYYAYFWSSTEYSSTVAWYRTLHYYREYVSRYYYAKSTGFSARCVQD